MEINVFKQLLQEKFFYLDIFEIICKTVKKLFDYNYQEKNYDQAYAPQRNVTLMRLASLLAKTPNVFVTLDSKVFKYNTE